MKEHPILFSQRMAKAIREGRKTQTRRTHIRNWSIGDTLWIRESHYLCELPGEGVGNYFLVFEDEFDGSNPRPPKERPYQGRPGHRPSIFMPRWWCRTFLEITGVRCEKLQDITDEDAVAEGVESREAFMRLWDSLNTRRGSGWGTNPLVGVTEFRLSKNGDGA